MKILLVRRHGDRMKQGGISLSGDLITNYLTAQGVRVIPHPHHTPLQSVPDGTDLVWVYAELETVRDVLKAARAKNVPVLVNSTFDNTGHRMKWLLSQLKEWDPDDRKDIFLGVFSYQAETHPGWGSRRSQIVALPKLIRPHPPHPTGELPDIYPFERRSGICVGDLAKLLKPRLNGIDVPEALKRMSGLGYPVTTYFQYNYYRNSCEESSFPVGITDGVSFVQDQSRFQRELGRYRLFLHFPSKETFAMVPMEAQGAGTPVMYPHMPQSLSQTIGHTGLLYRNIEELVDILPRLYEDKDTWTQWHQAGLANAQAHHPKLMAAVLENALMGVVARHKRP